jgi:amphi-Trp domain-containing protein
MPMDLIEIEEDATMTREEAAERLRALADQLSRHNEVTFTREGQRYTVKVPTQVRFSFELEVGEESELEVEISW